MTATAHQPYWPDSTDEQGMWHATDGTTFPAHYMLADEEDTSAAGPTRGGFGSTG